MKNLTSVNVIIAEIKTNYGDHRDYDGFNTLLRTSGVEEDDALLFYAYPEDQQFPIGIAYEKLKERLLLDEKFFLKFASNLVYSVSKEGSQTLREVLAGGNYLFNDERGFYKADEALLSGADKKAIQSSISSGNMEWRCHACGDLLDHLDSLEKIEAYIGGFKKGKYEKCPKSSKHTNQFHIKDGRITFSSAPIKLEQAFMSAKNIVKPKEKK